MQERRDTQRHRVLKAATIEFGAGAAIDCTVRNLSANGAALDVASPVGIPATFDLLILRRPWPASLPRRLAQGAAHRRRVRGPFGLTAHGRHLPVIAVDQAALVRAARRRGAAEWSGGGRCCDRTGGDGNGGSGIGGVAEGPPPLPPAPPPPLLVPVPMPVPPNGCVWASRAFSEGAEFCFAPRVILKCNAGKWNYDGLDVSPA